MLTKRFDEALLYAHDLHRDQTRKGTLIPYFSHLMTVSALVIEHGGDEDRRSPACCTMLPRIRAAPRRLRTSSGGPDARSRKLSMIVPTHGPNRSPNGGHARKPMLRGCR